MWPVARCAGWLGQKRRPLLPRLCPCGLAAVTSTGYLGFLVGPPIIGGLAELVGLPSALVVVVLLAGVVALLAPTTRYARPGPGVAREPQTVAA